MITLIEVLYKFLRLRTSMTGIIPFIKALNPDEQPLSLMTGMVRVIKDEHINNWYSTSH
jgi:hypothetical protein